MGIQLEALQCNIESMQDLSCVRERQKEIVIGQWRAKFQLNFKWRLCQFPSPSLKDNQVKDYKECKSKMSMAQN